MTAAAAEYLLEVEQVAKRYEAPEAGGPRLEVLHGVSLRLAAGERAAIVGPSGSGKSTLLNLIGALDRPTSGTVKLAGRDLSKLSEVEAAEVRNRFLGFVFQLHHLLSQCNVWENVLMPTLAVGDAAFRRAAEERARRLLRRVGLEERARHRPGLLSGGERQRAAVARALVNGPKLLLADEPTGSLDRAAAEELIELLCELNREEGTALLVVTHAENLAARMSRRLELRDGRLTPLGETTGAGGE